MLQRHRPKGEEERACLALQEDNVLEAKVAAIAEIHCTVPCMLNVCLWCPRVTECDSHGTVATTHAH